MKETLWFSTCALVHGGSELALVLFGIPPLIIVAHAVSRTSLDLRGAGWLLASITCAAPFQIVPIWHWSHGAGLLYGLLSYIAAMGFALHLAGTRLADRLQWPVLVVVVLTALAALTALPAVTVPAVLASRPDSYLRADDDSVNGSLRHLNRALREMQSEQDHLQAVTAKLLHDIDTRAKRLDEIQKDRAELLEEIAATEQARVKINERGVHATATWLDNVISFFIGIASSITTAVAASFFRREDPQTPSSSRSSIF